MNHASLGTISHGTLRTEDLLSAFADELEHYVKCSIGGADYTHEQYLAHTSLISEAREVDPESENADELVNESLLDALQEFAPPYCYFGAHPGDGADFGFWPDIDAIEELPRVQDSNEARELGEDCAFINDHGNVTVFGGDGSILLELV